MSNNPQTASTSESSSLKISFLGGTEMVTGANFMLSETGPAGQKFLGDCGLIQGLNNDEK